MNRNASLALFLGIVVVSLALLPALHQSAAEWRRQSEALSARPGSLEKRNTNAFARILGELRIGAADFMFVKTELYLHGGIGYAPHTDDLDDQVKSGPADSAGESGHPDPKDFIEEHDDHDHAEHGGHAPEHDPGETAAEHDHHDHGDHADHDDHEDGGGVQMRMRSAEEDFRGIIGDLEREIKPWRDPEAPHVLLGGAELLPWFRIMTIANPHFIRGYRIGAMWLGREDKFDEALEFLDEGIAKNPENPELFLLYLSKVLTLTQEAYGEGEASLREGLEAARTGLELGYRVRPEGGETGKIHEGLLWNEDLEEDLLFLTRFEVNLLDRLGREQEALNAARRHRRAFPEDGVLMRIEEKLQSEIREGNHSSSAEPALPRSD